MGKVFRLVFGAHRDTNVDPLLLKAVLKDLQESGIIAEISTDIRRDTFVKWAYISAMACTGAYYDVTMKEIQKKGNIRDTFIGLSKESTALGIKLGIAIEEDLPTYNLKVVDSLAPETTSSMQKDIARGHTSEIQELLFEMIALAEKHGIEVPMYRKVAEKFRK
jgi:2-dehydropantoate 2-reductase